MGTQQKPGEGAEDPRPNGSCARPRFGGDMGMEGEMEDEDAEVLHNLEEELEPNPEGNQGAG